MLVEAFERILQRGIKARLLIAGRIDDESVFEQLKPHFSDNIVYIGEQPDIRAIMSISDAFCLSSTMEGMPITIIEAFSVGCIPIVTPVGGCINMIKNGVNGFISQDITKDSYEVVLNSFINTPHSDVCTISNNGIRVFAENYSIIRSADRYILIFS